MSVFNKDSWLDEIRRSPQSTAVQAAISAVLTALAKYIGVPTLDQSSWSLTGLGYLAVFFSCWLLVIFCRWLWLSTSRMSSGIPLAISEFKSLSFASNSVVDPDSTCRVMPELLPTMVSTGTLEITNISSSKRLILKIEMTIAQGDLKIKSEATGVDHWTDQRLPKETGGFRNIFSPLTIEPQCHVVGALRFLFLPVECNFVRSAISETDKKSEIELIFTDALSGVSIVRPLSK